MARIEDICLLAVLLIGGVVSIFASKGKQSTTVKNQGPP